MYNQIAFIIRIIGVLEMVSGVIVGLYLGNDNSLYGTADVSIILLWSVLGFVSGMFFLGLGEIISLLQGIHTKLVGTDNEGLNADDDTNVNLKGKSKYDVYKEVMDKGN
ncbi:hypothetical protein [Bacillus sp. REN3]|uniref:hypothetical protein n=1 Tax=Bacillus sp. REN3 TaxID=2802440 RepID=UPI001AEE9ADD|nr:hypothetical protein [Bacillus sp. REN3]